MSKLELLSAALAAARHARSSRWCSRESYALAVRRRKYHYRRGVIMTGLLAMVTALRFAW
jgi:hypothetical protein